jgi:anti-sigma factor RsiW
MNDCQEITAQLTAYVDGLLEPEAQAHVDRHLGGCRGCRELAASERGGHAALRGRAAQLLAGPLPPGLRSRCEALARGGVCVWCRYC